MGGDTLGPFQSKKPTTDASLALEAGASCEILHLAADAADADAAVGGVAVEDQGTSLSPQIEELTLTLILEDREMHIEGECSSK